MRRSMGQALDAALFIGIVTILLAVFGKMVYATIYPCASGGGLFCEHRCPAQATLENMPNG